MGSWRLEVGRMFIYVLFPVGMFHLFNQPQIFEEWVRKTKDRLCPEEFKGKGLEFMEWKKEFHRQLETQAQAKLRENP